MTVLPHRSLREFQTYLEGQGYAESSIRETIRQAKFLVVNFPAGLSHDEREALLGMERAMAGRRATARSIGVCRTWTRRYHRFLLSPREVPA